MKRDKKVVSAVHDGTGRRVSLKYADGTELKFDKRGAVVGDPLQVIQDAEGFDDSAALWVDDGDGGLWLACNLGDLRRTLNTLARPNR